MRINHNIPALKVNNILAQNNDALQNAIQRLSTGYRINRAADDAAGLAISEKMKTQIAGLNQASRNASDGISVIQTAEGALIEVEEMVQRMRQLAVQAANGTMTDEDRSTLQDEVDQLMVEIDRISTTTEFNTKTLLDGTVDRRSYSSESQVSLVSLSDTVEVRSYSLTVAGSPSQASYRSKLTATTAPAEGYVYINDQAIKIEAGDDLDTMISKLTTGAGSNIYIGLSNTTADNSAPGKYETISTSDALANLADSYLTIVNLDYGDDSELKISCSDPQLAAALGISTAGTTSYGSDSVVTLDTSVGSGFTKTATATVDGDYITVNDRNGFSMIFKVDEGFTGDVTVTVLSAGPMTLQIGANEGQTMEVRIPRVDTTTLMINNADISTQSGASEAITMFNKAVIEISSIRAKLGAYENRLDHSIKNLDTSAENLTEALSRVIDTDMASEMTNYTQMQVLVQAATSMLSQANEQPQNVLNLLQR